MLAAVPGRGVLERRAGVARGGEGWKLVIDGDELALNASAEGWKAAAELKAFLNRHHVRLAPRALTLTAYLRLMIADQFAHGIGGGRYDQVTDAVISRFFKTELRPEIYGRRLAAACQREKPDPRPWGADR